VIVENRDGVFPIHRGLKFLLLTAFREGSTISIPCRSGVRSPAVLDTIPDVGDVDGSRVARIESFRDQLAVPDILPLPTPRSLLEQRSSSVRLAPLMAAPRERTPPTIAFHGAEG
jgi:hypothetical protein